MGSIMDQEKIGKFIRTLREGKGWTQDDLSNKLYISRQMISNIELGKMLPSHDKVIKLAEIFEVSILDIYSGEISKKIDKNETNKILVYIESYLNSKIKKFLILSIIAFTLLVSSFCFYYFLYTFNSVKIYQVYGSNENYKTDKGILVLTKENIYFKLNILSDDKSDFKYVNLKVNGENGDKLLLQIDDMEIFLVDFYGYNSFFDYNSIVSGKDKLYLEIININDDKELLNLEMIKKYENNSLFYKKRDKENLESENKFQDKKIPNIIETTFNKEDDYYKLNLNDKNKNVTLTYSIDACIFSVEEEYKKVLEIWDYDTDLKSLHYTKFDSDWNVLEEIKDVEIDEDNKIAIYFKNNYYNKYLK